MCTGGLLFKDHPWRYAMVVFTLFKIAFWCGVVAGLLHWRKWYWSV